MRPVVNHVVANQRDVFEIMEELLREKHGLPEENGAGGFQYEICNECGEPEEYFMGEEFPKVKGWLERLHGREVYMRVLEKGGGYDLLNFT